MTFCENKRETYGFSRGVAVAVNGVTEKKAKSNAKKTFFLMMTRPSKNKWHYCSAKKSGYIVFLFEFLFCSPTADDSKRVTTHSQIRTPFDKSTTGYSPPFVVLY